MYFLVQLTGQYTSTQVPFRVSYTGNLRQNRQFGIVTSQAIIDDCAALNIFGEASVNNTHKIFPLDV